MLAIEQSKTSALDYGALNSTIQETFSNIDRLEWQVVDKLQMMRDNKYYRDVGYNSFEDYCEHELTRFGGHRRVKELLAAKKVIDHLPQELKNKITKPSHARPLLNLVKTPQKLQQAVAIAAKEKEFPTQSDFAKAVQEVAPKNNLHNQTNVEGTHRQLYQTVRVSSKSHARYGELGEITAQSPNGYQQIVTFSDGEKMLISNSDLDESLDEDLARGEKDTIATFWERKYPPEYAEAIASLKEQHKQELQRLEQELRIGLLSDATARAEQQVQEELESLQQLFKQQKEQNIHLQQRLDEMEGLRQLEFENQQLRQRILELEEAGRRGSCAGSSEQREEDADFGSELTSELSNRLSVTSSSPLLPAKSLPASSSPLPDLVKQALDKTIDLRSLAVEPPKENAQECLLLMGMALNNLASAMNNTQALEAAAIILGSSPTLEAVTERIEQMQLLPVAVSQIKEVLAKPGCSWQDFWAVAQKYQSIELDYRAELTKEETELITVLQKVATQPPTIEVGSVVAHADPYCTLYLRTGEVVEDFGEEVLVAWGHWKDQSKKTDRYFKSELRLWQP